MSGDRIDLKPHLARLAALDPWRRSGAVVGLVGLLIESLGPAAGIGDFCEIQGSGRAAGAHPGNRISGRPSAFHAA